MEQARTRLARRAVVDAARELFLERGYAATTVEAISALADVPPATLYRLFASKLGILKALLDQSIAGDDAPVAVAARPDVAPLFEEPDPIALLAGFAGVTTAINERTNDLHRVLVGAAESDPAAAELLAEIRDQRGRGQRQIARTLSRRRVLQPRLTAREAEDRVHALMSPEVYRLLVVDRDWSPEQYRTWLTATLAQQLL
ncbi:MAG TPA: helix-turn-helix domain-containing protein [Acidimicrobiia bacterium]|nr:helix-turn-helix domain-containing protein [Acidimicrobiia bacterium]